MSFIETSNTAALIMVFSAGFVTGVIADVILCIIMGDWL